MFLINEKALSDPMRVNLIHYYGPKIGSKMLFVLSNRNVSILPLASPVGLWFITTARWDCGQRVTWFSPVLPSAPTCTLPLFLQKTKALNNRGGHPVYLPPWVQHYTPAGSQSGTNYLHMRSHKASIVQKAAHVIPIICHNIPMSDFLGWYNGAFDSPPYACIIWAA